MVWALDSSRPGARAPSEKRPFRGSPEAEEGGKLVALRPDLSHRNRKLVVNI